MLFGTAIIALVASLEITWAAPTSEAAGDSELRLVKTSEEDPGQWVTEAQKFELFTSKNIGFIDITDIKVCRPRISNVVKEWSTKCVGYRMIRFSPGSRSVTRALFPSRPGKP